jgi:hypothetical protein
MINKDTFGLRTLAKLSLKLLTIAETQQPSQTKLSKQESVSNASVLTTWKAFPNFTYRPALTLK